MRKGVPGGGSQVSAGPAWVGGQTHWRPAGLCVGGGAGTTLQLLRSVRAQRGALGPSLLCVLNSERELASPFFQSLIY